MYFMMTGRCVLGLDHSEETYDGCIISIHAPDALRILGAEATYEESRVLGAFQYINRYCIVCILSSFRIVLAHSLKLKVINGCIEHYKSSK